ncbi:MAG TPA: DUF3237 domain-containing protein [Methylomirabilota bacterium]|nr:DUF3237 domain-containing protein [Methylomirabilota bacterium]
MGDLKTELLCEMSADLEEPQDIGTTPYGNRRIISVTGGSFAGPRLKGEVLPGGGDWLLIRPDGVRQLDVRATLRTDDGHLIYVSYRGIADISPAVFQRLLRGEAVDPAEYYFRTTPVFETGSEKYGWLNRIVTVGVGTRTPTGVGYIVYAIL